MRTVLYRDLEKEYCRVVRVGSNSREILINGLYHNIELPGAYSLDSLMLISDVKLYLSAVRKVRKSVGI